MYKLVIIVAVAFTLGLGAGFVLDKPSYGLDLDKAIKSGGLKIDQ